MDAEAKLGEMLAAIERKYEHVGSFNGTDVIGDKNPPKQKKTLPKNITKKESHFAQTIANRKEIAMEKYIIEDFKVEDFRNVELSQIKALSDVLYKENLEISDKTHWDLCFLLKSKMDDIWDGLETVIRAEIEAPRVKPDPAGEESDEIDSECTTPLSDVLFELGKMENYFNACRDKTMGMPCEIDPEIVLMLISITEAKIRYYEKKYAFLVPESDYISCDTVGELAHRLGKMEAQGRLEVIRE